MLKNILKADKNKDFTGIIKLKYNGMTVTLKPGQTIDVRDYDVANKDVLGAEKHLINKYPNTFQQTKNIGDPDRDKAVEEEIKALKDQVESLRKEKEDLTKVNKELAANVETASGEKQNLIEEKNKMKRDHDEMKSKFDDMEEEIENLRLQLNSGKTVKKGK